ncbi:hypothetical protein COI44_11725 [Bacillus sp. AFS088145]|nr:hypothetical protein COI44_11725 [Bacillus sp. AFS088145]
MVDGARIRKDNKFWNLEKNEYIDISFGVKHDESATNDYQGVTYSANLSVIAKQKYDVLYTSNVMIISRYSKWYVKTSVVQTIVRF